MLHAYPGESTLNINEIWSSHLSTSFWVRKLGPALGSHTLLAFPWLLLLSETKTKTQTQSTVISKTQFLKSPQTSGSQWISPSFYIYPLCFSTSVSNNNMPPCVSEILLNRHSSLPWVFPFNMCWFIFCGHLQSLGHGTHPSPAKDVVRNFREQRWVIHIPPTSFSEVWIISFTFILWGRNAKLAYLIPLLCN